jgi:hypothetical protein
MSKTIEPYAPYMRSYSRVDAVIDMFAAWLKHRRELAEVCDCDVGDMNRVAQDLGVSASELEGLVRRGHHASDELPKMMREVGLDPETIARHEALVMRDMERVCAYCRDKVRCRQDLVAGTAAQNHEDYCGNATTMASLGARHP